MSTARRYITIFWAFSIAVLIFWSFTLKANGTSQAEIDALKNSANELEQKRNSLMVELQQSQVNRDSLLGQKTLVEQQILNLDAQIQNSNDQINLYKGLIAQKKMSIVATEEKERQQYKLFCQRARAIEERGEISYLSIIGGAHDFLDMLDRLALAEQVAEYDTQVINTLVLLRNNLELELDELEQFQAELLKVQTNQQKQMQELTFKKSEIAGLLFEISKQIELTEESLTDIENSAKEIDQEIEKKQRELEQKMANTSMLLNVSGDYVWPLPSQNLHITSLFAGRIHPITGIYGKHNGVDVAAPEDTPIYAAQSGIVLAATYHYSYGNYVSISHGNNNSTLYAHMTSYTVSEDEYVTQGQVIGYVGTTGSSTGYHLHFEIRTNGLRTDPLQYYPNIQFNY